MSKLTADPRAVLITIVHARRVSTTRIHASDVREGVPDCVHNVWVSYRPATLGPPRVLSPTRVLPVTYFHWRIRVHNVIYYIKTYIREPRIYIYSQPPRRKSLPRCKHSSTSVPTLVRYFSEKCLNVDWMPYVKSVSVHVDNSFAHVKTKLKISDYEFILVTVFYIRFAIKLLFYILSQ